MTPPTTIDEYIATFPAYVQAVLQKVRATIRKSAPGAEEAIKYQMPTFVLNGNLVHFAAFKNQGKGSVQFPLDKPIPYGLIGRIVKFRVKENLEKAKAKRK
jgi:uncharacterized protein YdhG (YjbR/CyaY superfamily)